MKGYCLFVFYVNEWGVLLHEARFAFDRKFRGNSIEFGNCFENSRNIFMTKVNTQFLSKGRIAKFEGYIKTSSKLYPLPIGSTLDKEKGIFYWQPGTGFVGDYKLVFIGSEKSRGIWKKIINVKVTPKLTK